MSDNKTKISLRFKSWLIANFCWKNNKTRLIYGSIGFLIVFIPSLVLNLMAKSDKLPWNTWPFYQLTYNPGIAFGKFEDKPALIYVFQILIILLMICLLLINNSRFCCLFIAAAFSGGLFNFADRLNNIGQTYPFGCVIDYLDTRWLGSTCSNLPDVCIIGGVILYFITSIIILIINFRQEIVAAKKQKSDVPPTPDNNEGK